ncbi:hypothetical protein EOW77_0034560 [Bradyrhizobium yuanmingense]|nr:hypothetical protein EOW77_0034560 [Bradyrhizobium yuanmingense]
MPGSRWQFDRDLVVRGRRLIEPPRPERRHCEERLRRSNPDCLRGESLDCFAALAMTAERARSRIPPIAPRVVRWQEDAIIKRQPPARCGCTGRSHATSTDHSWNRGPVRRARRALAAQAARRSPA